MRHGIGLVLLAAAVLGCGASAVADAPSNAQASVDQRVAAMKQMGGKVNEAFQLSGTNASEARTKLATALTIAQTIPSMFPKGTGDGDPGVTSSRALPKIWSDQAGFQKTSDGLVAAMKFARGLAVMHSAEHHWARHNSRSLRRILEARYQRASILQVWSTGTRQRTYLHITHRLQHDVKSKTLWQTKAVQ